MPDREDLFDSKFAEPPLEQADEVRAVMNQSLGIKHANQFNSAKLAPACRIRQSVQLPIPSPLIVYRQQDAFLFTEVDGLFSLVEIIRYALFSSTELIPALKSIHSGRISPCPSGSEVAV